MVLKDHGLVAKFEMLDNDKACVELVTGKSLVVYMPDDYVIGFTSVRGAVAKNPHPDYIVYNHWNEVTGDAIEEARRLRIPLVKYGRFHYIPNEMVDAAK